MLQRFKSSSDTREQEIFACMVHNLFDEYRFFHNYPEPELRITGILFGALIQHQLVSSITLGIALRYVLEALRKPSRPDASGKMFRFGMFALEQFKDRLGEWPQYCSHIVQIPNLIANHNTLVQEIEQSMQRPTDRQRLPPTAVPPGPPKLVRPDGSAEEGQAPQHQQHLPQVLPPGGYVRQSSTDAGGEEGVGAGAMGASPVMRGQPPGSMQQGQGSPDPHSMTLSGVMGIGAGSEGGRGLANDRFRGHMGGLGAVLGGIGGSQRGGGAASGGQMQGDGGPVGHGHPGQIGENQLATMQQQQAGGGGMTAGAAGEGQQQLGQVQQPPQGASPMRTPGPQATQHSPFDSSGRQPTTIGGGDVDAASAFGGGAPGSHLMDRGGGATARGGDGKNAGGESGASGRLGPELGLSAALGFSGQSQQQQTGLGMAQAGGGLGNVGGGVAAGAPGHETWGPGAGGQALPQAGAVVAASVHGPSGAGGAPTGALPVSLALKHRVTKELFKECAICLLSFLGYFWKVWEMTLCVGEG